ncbi:conserved hypothetical protein [Coccidioides posadasii str. Silveira]|uniref:Uncharacterized protein n=1 Tax=Coccidioides posadasii (strain RMSCC 757 / Silveira) TaxID=443226 RepID=E9DJU9_COCPS|nr:conserved hypothetical protein [Coccidioides posadasii str. Silveira]
MAPAFLGWHHPPKPTHHRHRHAYQKAIPQVATPEHRAKTCRKMSTCLDPRGDCGIDAMLYVTCGPGILRETSSLQHAPLRLGWRGVSPVLVVRDPEGDPWIEGSGIKGLRRVSRCSGDTFSHSWT